MERKYNGKEAYFGNIVSRYDLTRKSEDIWKIEDKYIIKELRSGISKESTILDIPCGTGRFFQHYKSSKINNVIGIDISSDMINYSKYVSNSLSLKCALYTGDITSIPLKDSSVDLIFCFRLFHLLPFEIIECGIKELYRVAKNTVYVEVFSSSIKGKPKIITDIESLNKIESLKVKISEKLFRTARIDQSGWLHIENFQSDVDQIESRFIDCGFKISKVTFLNSRTSSAYVYKLIK